MKVRKNKDGWRMKVRRRWDWWCKGELETYSITVEWWGWGWGWI